MATKMSIPDNTFKYQFLRKSKETFRAPFKSSKIILDYSIYLARMWTTRYLRTAVVLPHLIKQMNKLWVGNTSFKKICSHCKEFSLRSWHLFGTLMIVLIE